MGQGDPTVTTGTLTFSGWFTLNPWAVAVVQVGAVKIYVAAVEALRKKRKEEMKLSLLPNLVEKLVWVLVISFCKISFRVKHLMPY